MYLFLDAILREDETHHPQVGPKAGKISNEELRPYPGRAPQAKYRSEGYRTVP